MLITFKLIIKHNISILIKNYKNYKNSQISKYTKIKQKNYKTILRKYSIVTLFLSPAYNFLSLIFKFVHFS